MSTQHRWRPRKTEARLEVLASIDSFVESPTRSILVRKDDLLGLEVVIHLLVICFHPRRVRLVAQASIHRQPIREPPSILGVSGKDLGRLLPSSPRAQAAPELRGKAKEKVSHALARIG